MVIKILSQLWHPFIKTSPYMWSKKDIIICCPFCKIDVVYSIYSWATKILDDLRIYFISDIVCGLILTLHISLHLWFWWLSIYHPRSSSRKHWYVVAFLIRSKLMLDPNSIEQSLMFDPYSHDYRSYFLLNCYKVQALKP